MGVEKDSADLPAYRLLEEGQLHSARLEVELESMEGRMGEVQRVWYHPRQGIGNVVLTPTSCHIRLLCLPLHVRLLFPYSSCKDARGRRRAFRYRRHVVSRVGGVCDSETQ